MHFKFKAAILYVLQFSRIRQIATSLYLYIYD